MKTITTILLVVTWGMAMLALSISKKQGQEIEWLAYRLEVMEELTNVSISTGTVAVTFIVEEKSPSRGK